MWRQLGGGFGGTPGSFLREPFKRAFFWGDGFLKDKWIILQVDHSSSGSIEHMKNIEKYISRVEILLKTVLICGRQISG